MSLRQAAQQALELLERYRNETPLGHQPHMIADVADKTIAVLKQALAEPEPVTLPCCGYTNASAVKWNPHNQVVQCHNCGQVYTAPTPQPEQEPWPEEPVGHIAGGVKPSSEPKSKAVTELYALFGAPHNADINLTGLIKVLDDLIEAYKPTPRKPLTDEEITTIASTPCAVVGSYVHTFARAIEAAHGIKEQEHE